MYKIKESPEDFIVDEIPDRAWSEQGSFSVIKVKKKNMNTESVAQFLTKILHVKRSFIAYAGTKDRNAITTQFFSIKGVRKEQVQNLRLDKVTFEHVGYTNEPLSLGSSKGNRFIIVVRNLDDAVLPRSLVLIPNFFGPQRFGISGTNADIGKCLVKKQFKEASELIIESGGDQASIVQDVLQKQKNNYSTAFRSIPKKIFSLYIHSYQSLLFNEMLQVLLDVISIDDLLSIKIPLIGFDTEEPSFPPLKKVFNLILEREQLTQRDFIIREIPDLTSEGDLRSASIPINDLIIGTPQHDELNLSKQKITLSFSLPKGAYATVAVKELFKK